MSGITTSDSNYCNQIGHQFYTLQEKIFGLCSTDHKVQAYVLGGVLLAAALASIGAAVGCAFIFAPIALVGLIPAVALGILGLWMISAPDELYEMRQMARPFVAGQPVGLNNGGNNCWLNSSLQLLANVPAFAQRMRQIPDLAQFLDSYTGDRNGFNKVSSTIDSHQIRQTLHRETGGLIDAGHNQEDPSQFFEYLFQGPNALYRFEQRINGAVSNFRTEPMIQLDIDRSGAIPNFNQLFSTFLDHRTDIGQRVQLFFPRAPDDLLIQAKRFYREANVAQGKISDSIQTPERFDLPSGLVRSGENASYECDAFLQHHGATQGGGHYVAYIKTAGVWWCCSDTEVYEVSQTQAQNAMNLSYIIHYAKV